jgi:hypothetical protein
MLDSYIYDSQFSFLNQQPELERNYINNVLSKTFLFKNEYGKAYLKAETWDSEKFGKSFGRLVWLENRKEDNFYSEVLKESTQFECTYIRLNKDHSFCKWAEKKSLPVLSSKISQHISLENTQLEFSENPVNWSLSDHFKDGKILEQVIALSKTSFAYNRFKSDSHFTNEMIEKIYGNWVFNEFTSTNSKLYLIFVNEKVASFFLYRENISPLQEYKTGFVSLIASSPDYKEKRHASNLLNFVFNKAKLENTKFVIANPELKNSTALNFFKKNNFVETSILNEYHIWS